MTPARPLPTVIGPTENALRALLSKILSTTEIKTYAAWVFLNAASKADAAASDGSWQRAVGDALKVDQVAINEVRAQLATDRLVGVSGSLTAHGAVELSAARSAVARVTAQVVEGLSEEEQESARRVLERVRRNAEHLLSL